MKTPSNIMIVHDPCSCLIFLSRLAHPASRAVRVQLPGPQEEDLRAGQHQHPGPGADPHRGVHQHQREPEPADRLDQEQDDGGSANQPRWTQFSEKQLINS